MKSYNESFIVNNNKKRNSTECITVPVLLTCQYFTHKISIHWQLSVTSVN